MHLHKATGQARVDLGDGVTRKSFYLGVWGSRAASRRYDEVIASFLAAGRRLPEESSHPATVSHLADRFIAWAAGYYVKRGKPTNTALKIRLAMEWLYRAGLGDVHPAAFGPLNLKAFQAFLACEPTGRWTRATINQMVTYVVSMFEWAVSEELVNESVWRALQSVRHLSKGRPIPGTGTIPREGGEVEPAPLSAVQAVLKHAPPMLAAMINVQLLTAMRPGAMLYMRAKDLHETDDKRVRRYQVDPEAFKLEHLEGISAADREVFIGPKAWKILKPLLPADPAEFVFNPRRSEELRNAARREARVCEPSKSYDPTRRRKLRPRRAPADHYSIASYRRAIWRCCEAAGLKRDRVTGVDEWWSPNQLRHTAASYIAEHEDVEVAQLILGHKRITTTMKYVKTRPKRAIAAARKHG